MTPAPSQVRVRAYQVGFGDCFLITVTYPAPLPDGRTQAHLLVDFGAKVRAPGGPRMADLAPVIAEHCGGHLDVVVVTHRHQDHLRGFGDAKARAHLTGLAPDLVVRPWTDRPTHERAALDQGSRGFANLLDTVDRHNLAVSGRLKGSRRDVAKRAQALADLGISNPEAVRMLDRWVDPAQTRWVEAGDTVSSPGVLPGVRIEVLGPPTLAQVPGLQSYASGSTEYWLDAAGRGDLDRALGPAVPDAELVAAKQTVAAPAGLGRAAYLLDQLHAGGQRQVLDIVEGFEEVLNNTSVVLLVTIGARSLLLAGDAQVENWSYTLDRAYGANGRRSNPALRKRLAEVDLYKVGHHGSRNATPRRLVDLWRHDRPAGRPLCSVMSTRAGVYGTSAEGKVPKPELVDALAALGEVHSTEKLPADVWWFDVTMPTGGEASFDHQEGPVRPH